MPLESVLNGKSPEDLQEHQISASLPIVSGREALLTFRQVVDGIEQDSCLSMEKAVLPTSAGKTPSMGQQASSWTLRN